MIGRPIYRVIKNCRDDNNALCEKKSTIGRGQEFYNEIMIWSFFYFRCMRIASIVGLLSLCNLITGMIFKKSSL